MKVLVTGRDGQLARSLIERAEGRDGIELLAVGRPDLDLEVLGSAAQAIAAALPDVVINAAAYTAVDPAEDEPERAFRINADAAGEVAGAAREVGAAVIQMSTDYVFDGRSAGPYGEDAATNPLGVYGRSKLAGEDQVGAANSDHLILRTAWVYSPFGRNFVKTMIAAAETRDVLTVVDDQVGNPTSALDLADGILAVIDSWRSGGRIGVGQTYHLAGGGSTSWCGFAQAIMAHCRAIGRPAADVSAIRTDDWPTKAVRPRNSTLDCAKFVRDFGFTMPQWRDSLPPIVERIVRRA